MFAHRGGNLLTFYTFDLYSSGTDCSPVVGREGPVRSPKRLAGPSPIYA